MADTNTAQGSKEDKTGAKLIQEGNGAEGVNKFGFVRGGGSGGPGSDLSGRPPSIPTVKKHTGPIY